MSDPEQSSDSSSNSSSSGSDSSRRGGVKKFRLSSEKSASLADWVVSGLDDTRAKSAREAFRPKLKKNADLLINPNLDDAFYIRLKAVKSSSAAKVNIDPIEKIYRNQTFKILDLVKPIMFLASRLKKKKKSRADAKAVKTALKLWAVVYHDITNARRRNILAQIYPQNIGLLDDKAVLPTGGEHLFGPKFTQALVEQVKTLNALENAGAPRAPGSKGGHDQRQSSRDFSHPPSSSGGRYSNFKGSRSASLKGRRGEQRSRSSSPETGVGSGTKGSSATKGRPFAKPISRALNMSVTQKVVGCLRSNVLTILNIAGVFSGVVLALALRSSREEKWTQREIVYVGFVGDLFLRMLKCLILPLIVSSMISAVGSLDLSVSGRIGTRAIVYYMTTTVSAVILGIILVLTIHPGEGSDKGIVRGGSVRHVTTADMLMDLIRNLFPPNLVQACTAQYKTVLTPPADYLESLANMTNSNGTDAGNMTAGKPKNLYDWKMSSDYEDATNILGLVVFSTVLGITLGRMGAKGKPLLNFFVSMSEAVMMITGWVVWLSPVGVMFLVASKMLEMESWEVMLGQLGMYFFTVMIGLFIHGFVVLQLIYFIVTRKLPFRYVGNLSEALATAFATSSSSATLPVALKCLEEKNQVDPRVTRFVMPIGATINMDGTALYEAVAAIFISQVRGIHLTMGNVVAVSITATAASIGAAGIPQAGIVTMVMVLDTLGLPAEDVSLIMAVDWFLDRFRTFTNVLGDSLGAGIVHHLSRHELEEMPIEPASGRRESDIELDGPLAGADLEKGESSNGGPSSRNPNVTSAAVEVEWQSTSM